MRGQPGGKIPVFHTNPSRSPHGTGPAQSCPVVWQLGTGAPVHTPSTHTLQLTPELSSGKRVCAGAERASQKEVFISLYHSGLYHSLPQGT